MASMSDLVFLLLIFFMLSSYFVSQPGIKITLPFASNADTQASEIIIYITEDSKIFLGDREVSYEDLSGELDKVAVLNSHKPVILKADEKIDLGLAVKVMDCVKRSNIENVIISTRNHNEK